ncbi:MAG: hypothetical protein ACK46X_07355 [Candidatus Sericytochromatia bacterium]
MIEKTQSQPLVLPPKHTPAPPPAPEATQPKPAPEQAPRVARDTASIAGSTGKSSSATLPAAKKQDEFNPLDPKDSAGRTAADVGSNVVTGVEVAKDARGIAGLFSSLAGRASSLSRVGSGLAAAATKVGGAVAKVADWGDDIARHAPKLARGFASVAKAAPIIGIGMAGLDIGRAIMETDPEKKREAKGTAVLSTVSGVAGIAGAAMLATPLAPLGVGLMAVGIGASVFSFVDTTFFKGAASKRIGDAVDAVADAGKAVGDAVAGGAKKVWGAITSL